MRDVDAWFQGLTPAKAGHVVREDVAVRIPRATCAGIISPYKSPGSQGQAVIIVYDEVSHRQHPDEHKQEQDAAPFIHQGIESAQDWVAVCAFPDRFGYLKLIFYGKRFKLLAQSIEEIQNINQFLTQIPTHCASPVFITVGASYFVIYGVIYSFIYGVI